MTGSVSAQCSLYVAMFGLLAACGGDIGARHSPSDASTQSSSSPSGKGADAALETSKPDLSDASGDANDNTQTEGSSNRDGSVTSDAGLAVGRPVFVAVGYAGRRLRSLDLGQTWSDDVRLGGGGDDEFLLRAVHFANGVFVAGGYKILTSVDGSAASWVERDNPRNQWLGAIRWGNGGFVATGGYGTSWTSPDGLSWQIGGVLGEEASRELVFGAGLFTTWTEPGHHFWSSPDGQAWTQLPGEHASGIAFCAGEPRDDSACADGDRGAGYASAAGVTVRVWNGGLERTEAGGEFVRVSPDGPELVDVSVGYITTP